jgi:hypothetical protein
MNRIEVITNHFLQRSLNRSRWVCNPPPVAAGLQNRREQKSPRKLLIITYNRKTILSILLILSKILCGFATLREVNEDEQDLSYT